MASTINGFSNLDIGNALIGRQPNRTDARNQAKEVQPQAQKNTNVPVLTASPDVQMANGKKYNFNAPQGSYIDITV